MLGVSDDQIIESFFGYLPSPEKRRENTILLELNETDPIHIVTDITRIIAVTKEADDQYRVDADGMGAGSMRVTADGVAGLGRSLLGSRDEIPEWLITHPEDPARYPWWVPDSYPGELSITCERCGAETPASEIVTPSGGEATTPPRYCGDCWDGLRT